MANPSVFLSLSQKSLRATSLEDRLAMKKPITFATLRAKYPEYVRGIWAARKGMFDPSTTAHRKNAETQLARDTHKFIQRQEEIILEYFNTYDIPPSLVSELRACVHNHRGGCIALLNELIEFFPGVVLLRLTIKKKFEGKIKSAAYIPIYNEYEQALVQVMDQVLFAHQEGHQT